MSSAVKLCNFQYCLIGISNMKGNLSPWTYILLLSVMWAFGYFSGSIINNGPTNRYICAQFLCLGLIACFLTVPILRYRKKIAKIAEECDMLPELDVPWNVEREFFRFRSLNLKSIEFRFVRLNSYMVAVSGSSLILRPIIFNLTLSIPLELPTSGRFDNAYFFWFAYVAMSIAMIKGTLACITTMEIFSSLILFVKIQYQLLEKAILEPTEDSNKTVYVRNCVRQHQKIIRLFRNIEEIYKKIMVLTYFGILGSTSLTRSLLIGNVEIKIVIMLLCVIVVTTAYLSPYCVTMEGLIEANENLLRALYFCQWPDYEEHLKKTFKIMMLRCLLEPDLRIYKDGPSLNLRGFIVMVNGTFTFIVTSFLF